MKKIIIANWKMNPLALKEAEALLKKIWLKGEKKLSDLEVVIAPPFVYLESLISKSKSLKMKTKFGAQNCFWENQGAYTGEISPLMLKNSGVKYVIVGHSERRGYLAESDAMVSRKIKIVFENKLTPVLCVGETLKQRGEGAEKHIVKNQLAQDLKEIHNLKTKPHSLVVAYEPVWAIGTGNYCRPEEALEMIKFIKEILGLNGLADLERVKFLYGGSVNAGNVASYVRFPEIDGVLVGGASIKIKEFKKIIDEVSKSAEAEPAQK